MFFQQVHRGINSLIQTKIGIHLGGFYPTKFSKRFFSSGQKEDLVSSDSFDTRKFISLIEEQGMKELSKQNKLSLLFYGIVPTKKVKVVAIPKNFFLEDDPEYKSEKLNEKITVFSRIK